MKTRCAECKWKYPESYLSQAFINGGYTKPICALCYLEILFKLTGIRRTQMSGEMAESMRLSAIEWREKHPNDAPEKSKK